MVGRHDAAEAPEVAEAAHQKAMAASAAALVAAAAEMGAARVAEVTSMRCCHKCGTVEFGGRTVLSPSTFQ